MPHSISCLWGAGGAFGRGDLGPVAGICCRIGGNVGERGATDIVAEGALEGSKDGETVPLGYRRERDERPTCRHSSRSGRHRTRGKQNGRTSCLKLCGDTRDKGIPREAGHSGYLSRRTGARPRRGRMGVGAKGRDDHVAARSVHREMAMTQSRLVHGSWVYRSSLHRYSWAV